MKKFNPHIRLEIRFKGQSNLLLDINKENPIQLKVSGTFTQKLRGLATGNTGTVKITNLNQSNRARLVIDEASKARGFAVNGKIYQVVCSVFAGYDGQEFAIFTGDVMNASSTKQGTDWTTSLQLQTGATQLGADIAAASKTPLAGFTGSQAREFAYPVPVMGSPEQAFREIEGKSLMPNLDGGLRAVATDFNRRGLVPVINAETGLLRVPEIKGDFVKVGCIFDPRFLLGQLVQVESLYYREVNKQYRIDEITHSVDNYGQNTTELSLAIKL